MNLKIGILSDPHRRSDLQKSALEKLLQEGARTLLHAGDFCIEENLRQLEETGLPYAAVFGNNDRSLLPLASFYRIKKEPWYLKIDALTVKLMHLPYYLTPDTDLIVYGHTHRFACEFKGSSLYLNPGELCGRERERCECALLLYDNGEWEVTRLHRPLHREVWEKKIYRFSASTNASA